MASGAGLTALLLSETATPEELGRAGLAARPTIPMRHLNARGRVVADKPLLVSAEAAYLFQNLDDTLRRTIKELIDALYVEVPAGRGRRRRGRSAARGPRLEPRKEISGAAVAELIGKIFIALATTAGTVGTYCVTNMEDALRAVNSVLINVALNGRDVPPLVMQFLKSLIKGVSALVASCCGGEKITREQFCSTILKVFAVGFSGLLSTGPAALAYAGTEQNIPLLPESLQGLAKALNATGSVVLMGLYTGPLASMFFRFMDKDPELLLVQDWLKTCKKKALFRKDREATLEVFKFMATLDYRSQAGLRASLIDEYTHRAEKYPHLHYLAPSAIKTFFICGQPLLVDMGIFAEQKGMNPILHTVFASGDVVLKASALVTLISGMVLLGPSTNEGVRDVSGWYPPDAVGIAMMGSESYFLALSMIRGVLDSGVDLGVRAWNQTKDLQIAGLGVTTVVSAASIVAGYLSVSTVISQQGAGSDGSAAPSTAAVLGMDTVIASAFFANLRAIIEPLLAGGEKLLRTWGVVDPVDFLEMLIERMFAHFEKVQTTEPETSAAVDLEPGIAAAASSTLHSGGSRREGGVYGAMDDIEASGEAVEHLDEDDLATYGATGHVARVATIGSSEASAPPPPSAEATETPAEVLEVRVDRAGRINFYASGEKLDIPSLGIDRVIKLANAALGLAKKLEAEKEAGRLHPAHADALAELDAAGEGEGAASATSWWRCCSRPARGLAMGSDSGAAHGGYYTPL